MESVTIGIDLGTTNTLACYMKKGKPTLIKFDGGDKMLPSALYVDKNGSYIIGQNAKSIGKSDPQNLIRSSKTFMGDPNKKWECRGKSLNPTDVATEILKKVKATVIKKLKLEDNTVIKAVITVPAYFNGKQKTETQNAGKRAGLEVIRIITEPMSAAVAAGCEKELSGKILVIDIGGGTYDLCILEADPTKGDYTVIDIDGDRHLGGDDFDNNFNQYFLERLSGKTGMDFSSQKASGLDSVQYDSAAGRLKDEVEKTKIALSDNVDSEVSLPNLFQFKGSPYTFDIEVERDQFDDACQNIYDKITTRLKNFLNKQQFSVDAIDNIILAGGSCYIPRIREDIEKLVNRKVDTELTLDTLVVIGACIVADYESSGIQTKGKFQDIISHSLGVEIIDDSGNSILSKILLKGEQYPCERTRVYTTSIDNQTSVDINIYETGSDVEDVLDIQYHDFRGSVTLDGIPPAEKGKPAINVTFSFDKSQDLKVTVEDQETHVRKQLVIRDNQKMDIKPKQLPVDFMLLLDTSGSMSGTPLKEAKKACNALVDEIIDLSVHRLGLVQFESQARLLLSLVQDKQAIHQAINSMSADGGTNMFDAFQLADNALRSSTNGKVVIMVSDGDPFDPDRTLQKVASMQNAGVKIIAIGVGNSMNEYFLRQLAENGLYYTIRNMSELEATFRTAIPAIMEKM